MISKSLYDRVQRILQGRTNTKVQKHDFLFRRLLKCKACGYGLRGEWQKGHVYYRCHTTHAEPVCVREEQVEEAVTKGLKPLELSEREIAYVEKKVAELRKDWALQKDSAIASMRLRLSDNQARLSRLTDAYIDRMIEKDIFEERKTALLLERKTIQEQLAVLEKDSQAVPDRMAEFVELLKSAYMSYESKLPEEKRDFLKLATSNRWVDGKNVEIELRIPFTEVRARAKNTNGGPLRAIGRTWDGLIEKLMEFFKSNPAPVSAHGNSHTDLNAA